MTYDADTLYSDTFQGWPRLDLSSATSDITQQISPPPPTTMGASLDTYQHGLRQDLPLTSSDTTDPPLCHAFGITHISGWAEARSTLGATLTFEVDRGGGG
jgi:hypothetical protein